MAVDETQRLQEEESEEIEFVEKVPVKAEDIRRWYTAVWQLAQLADYSPVRGCMVIRPYGFALWENMVARLDARFKATGLAPGNAADLEKLLGYQAFAARARKYGESS